jgi:hypothetical protein
MFFKSRMRNLRVFYTIMKNLLVFLYMNDKCASVLCKNEESAAIHGGGAWIGGRMDLH